MADGLCPNCQSDKHIECCQRCGALVPKRRRGTLFCTQNCEERQAVEDRISAETEEEEQNG